VRGVDRDSGVVSEKALGAATLVDFERELLEYLVPMVGFDTACCVWSGHDGSVRQVTAREYCEAQLRRDFPRFMQELSPQELMGLAAGRPVVDADVLSTRRRTRLTVYRELLTPMNVSLFVTNVWHSRFGVFGFHFGRTGPTRAFKAGELQVLERILPSMKLAQALLASQELAVASEASEADWWVEEWGVTIREREIARLVARGFRNAEIAALLRISAHTVRNHLAATFRKASVSTRAELVFAMMSSEPLREIRRGRGGVARPWSALITSRSLLR
jgi:DNA-binding CsgD family transcriptional regulator